MKGLLKWILIVVWVSGVGISAAAARSDCTEPIPELFKRVSPSVVFI
jgi:hypothetical protein